MTSLRTSEASSSSSDRRARAEQGGEESLREGLADDGGLLQEAPLFGGEPVEAGRDERLQGLGDVEGADRRRLARSWHPPRTSEAPVDEHANGLDRIKRDAFGPDEDPVAHVVGETRARAR